MDLFIDNKSGVPIYEQIYTQIKTQIISGELAEDEALPSIRNSAKDLSISVITTKRAYDELEREGLIMVSFTLLIWAAAKSIMMTVNGAFDISVLLNQVSMLVMFALIPGAFLLPPINSVWKRAGSCIMSLSELLVPYLLSAENSETVF